MPTACRLNFLKNREPSSAHSHVGKPGSGLPDKPRPKKVQEAAAATKTKPAKASSSAIYCCLPLPQPHYSGSRRWHVQRVSLRSRQRHHHHHRSEKVPAINAKHKRGERAAISTASSCLQHKTLRRAANLGSNGRRRSGGRRRQRYGRWVDHWQIPSIGIRRKENFQASVD